MKNAPRIIGVSGYAQVGKSTFAQALVECEGYVEHSFAQPIKEMLYRIDSKIPSVYSEGYLYTLQNIVDQVGWETAKATWPEVRRLLQTLGTDAGRGLLGEDVWVDRAMAWIDHPEIGGSVCFVFADVRFPNEAEAIRARGGLVVEVKRPGVDALNDHASENSMDDIEFDYVIHNDGTIPELRQKAMDLISKEKGTFDYGKRIVDQEIREANRKLQDFIVADAKKQILALTSPTPWSDPNFPTVTVKDSTVKTVLHVTPAKTWSSFPWEPKDHSAEIQSNKLRMRVIEPKDCTTRVTLQRKDLKVGDVSPMKGEIVLQRYIEMGAGRPAEILVKYESGEITLSDEGSEHVVLRVPEKFEGGTTYHYSLNPFDIANKFTADNWIGSEP